jgi:dodecin
MSTVAKIIELTSSSTKSIEDAVETGIQRADKTLDNIESAWVQDIKCMVKNGKVSEWRVNMKVTFLLK